MNIVSTESILEKKYCQMSQIWRNHSKWHYNSYVFEYSRYSYKVKNFCSISINCKKKSISIVMNEIQSVLNFLYSFSLNLSYVLVFVFFSNEIYLFISIFKEFVHQLSRLQYKCYIWLSRTNSICISFSKKYIYQFLYHILLYYNNIILYC